MAKFCELSKVPKQKKAKYICKKCQIKAELIQRLCSPRSIKKDKVSRSV